MKVLITVFFACFTVIHDAVALFHGLFRTRFTKVFYTFYGIFFCNLKKASENLSLPLKIRCFGSASASLDAKKCLFYSVLHFVLRCYTLVLQIPWSCKTLVLQRYTSFLWEFYPCASFSYSRYFL